MPRPQYARHRVDGSQKAIIEAIEAAGWEVYRQLPVDLLCRKKADGQVKLLEVKVPLASGKPRLDKRQVSQAEFCKRTGTPYVTTVEEALRALGEVPDVPAYGDFSPIQGHSCEDVLAQYRESVKQAGETK